MATYAIDVLRHWVDVTLATVFVAFAAQHINSDPGGSLIGDLWSL
jgi:hypothetical protein